MTRKTTVSVNRHLVLEGLKELADEDFQFRVWVRGEGPGVSSLTETICSVFDDSGLELALDKGLATGFADKINAALAALGALVSKVDPGEDIEDTLTSSRWKLVVKKANAIVRMVESEEQSGRIDHMTP